MIKKLLLTIFCFSFFCWTRLLGTCNNACASANWETSSTWNYNYMPNCTDTIRIGSAYTVTITSVLDYTGCPGPMYIYIDGELKFQTGKKLKLPCNSVVYVSATGKVTPGNGGGSSDYIEICDVIVWSAENGQLSGPSTLTCCGGFLPVELLSFNVKKDQREIELKWSTASENQNEFFIVQRSRNGIDFENTNSISGAGTSNTFHSYELKDPSPVEGISYYRLKQVDFDGTYSYSSIKMIDMEFGTAIVFPNPAMSGQGGIILSNEVKPGAFLNVYDARGTFVATQSLNSSQSKIEGVLAPGFYTIELINGGKIERIPFVVSGD